MKIIRFLIFTVFFATQVAANVANTPQVNVETITFAQYLNLVGQNNLGFLAAKFDVNIAEAELRGARVFPDPEFSVGVFDNSDRRMLLGRGLELGLEQTLELGGKRRSRIQLARSEAQMATILLDGTLADLRAEAAIAFLETQKEMRLLELKQGSYEAMKQLFAFDSVRFQLGEISEVDLRHTRLETASLLNEVFLQEAQVKSSMAALNELAGRAPLQLLQPQNPLSKPVEREYFLGQLLDNALDDHVDLIIVMQQKQITRDQLRLTKAERAIDLGVHIGMEFNTEALNEEAPVPAFRAYTAGVTVPLRFSNLNRGAMQASQYAVQQAEKEYHAAELQVKRDIAQAFFMYDSRQRQVLQYEEGMLEDARRVFDGAMLSYRNGDIRLIEVLLAQQTYNGVRESYVETLFEYAASVVDLNRISGIWDVEF